MKTSPQRTVQRQRAFSLIELIVVIAIIVVIAGFTVPAASTMLRGSAITQASSVIVGQMGLARQQALTKNRSVEVRFYRFADPETPGETLDDPATWKFRAMQLFEVMENGVAVPMDKIQRLPNTVIFAYSEDESGGLSSIISPGKRSIGPLKPGSDDKTAPRLPRGVDFKYEYMAFRFLQDGSTSLKPTETWYVTLIGMNDVLKSPTEPPANFVTVQVDPVSGSTRSFRPSAG